MGRKTDLRLIHRLPLCVPETERMEALSLPEGGNTIMNDLDELNFTPLPPVTDQDLAMVRGVVNSNRLHMIKGLASVPLSEEFDFLGCDGRPIRIPDSVRHPGHKLEGAAQAAHMLRLTLTGAGPRLRGAVVGVLGGQLAAHLGPALADGGEGQGVRQVRQGHARQTSRAARPPAGRPLRQCRPVARRRGRHAR